MSKFGNFGDFCRDSTLPVCNLFDNRNPPRCELLGFTTTNGHRIRNLGDMIFCAIAIAVTIYLFLVTERRKAAVGRREMEFVLVGYFLINICQIFSLGGFLTKETIVQWFSAIQIGLITATFWVLLLNALIGFQWLDDGTPTSIFLVFGSAVILFVGTGYIAADTAFAWTSRFQASNPDTLKNVALYILYLLFPLVCLFLYFCLESFIVVKILGERRPLFILAAAALAFAIGQIFDFVISVHICLGTSGKIDGSMFETLFVLISVVLLWVFWISIVEGEYQESEAPASVAY